MNQSTGKKIPNPTLTNTKFISIYDSPLDSSRGLFIQEGLHEVKYCAEADIIVFNGGTDVATEMYGEDAVYTHSFHPSNRDKVEAEIFRHYPDKFKVGICRGAQFLNVMNGGRLWQDVNNHGHSHSMIDVRTGEKVMVTSTHHQMMRPNHKTGIVIGVSDQSTEKRSEHDHWTSRGGVFYDDDHKDTEIVWYPDTRSLCVQGHPEYVPGTHFAEYFFRLLAQCYTEVMTCAAW
jgi:Peptidase C26